MKAFTPRNSLAVANGASPIPATGDAARRLPPDMATEERDVGPLPTDLALMPFPGVIAPPQGPRTDLASLRAQFPFVPIMPFPSQVVGLFLPTANTPADLILPDGTALVMFLGASNVYVSNLGTAAAPSAAAPERGVFKPFNQWWFTKTRNFSVVSPDANASIQAICYIPTDLPNFG